MLRENGCIIQTEKNSIRKIIMKNRWNRICRTKKFF